MKHTQTSIGSTETVNQNATKSTTKQRISLLQWLLQFWKLHNVSLLLGVISISVGALFLTRTPSSILIHGKYVPLPRGYFLSWGKWKLPLFGDQFDYLQSMFTFFEERVQQFGNIFCTNLFFSPTIVLSGSEGMKVFYDSNLVSRDFTFPFHFVTGSFETKTVNDDAKFRERRHWIMRSIGDPERVKLYLQLAQPILDKYIIKWSVLNESFLFVEEMHWMMTEVMSKMMWGVKDEESFAKFIKPLNDQVLYGAQALPIPIPYLFAYGNSVKAVFEWYLEI